MKLFLVASCLLLALGNVSAQMNTTANVTYAETTSPYITTPPPTAPASDLLYGSCLTAAEFTDFLPVSSNKAAAVTELNKCDAAVLKTMAAVFVEKDCCGSWTDQLTLLEDSGVTCTIGACALDTTNTVTFSLKLDITNCDAYSAAIKAALINALATVTGLAKSLIKAETCVSGRRRLLAADVTAEIYAPSATAATDLRTKMATAEALTELNNELASEGVQVESLTDTTPTISAAVGLVPSLLLGFLGLVAGRFATKA